MHFSGRTVCSQTPSGQIYSHQTFSPRLSRPPQRDSHVLITTTAVASTAKTSSLPAKSAVNHASSPCRLDYVLDYVLSVPDSIPALISSRRKRQSGTQVVNHSNLLPVACQSHRPSGISHTKSKLALPNIRSLASKSYLINDAIASHKLDLVCLSETAYGYRAASSTHTANQTRGICL